jgi:tetratricopeptide (TPR) repeat protein
MDGSMRIVVLISCMLLAGCTVPFNLFGRKPPPPPAPSTWESDTTAGAKAYDEGHLDEAERRLEVARERAALSKDSDLELAASLVNLAVVRRAQGNLPDAIDLQQQALAIREKTLGVDHPEVAASLNSLAALHAARDDYASAEPLLVRALAIRERAFGADDRRTAKSANNLALLYAAQGRYADAEPLYQRATTIFEQHHDSAELATALENYAALLEETGRGEQAAEMEAKAQGLRQTKGVTGDQ